MKVVRFPVLMWFCWLSWVMGGCRNPSTFSSAFFPSQAVPLQMAPLQATTDFSPMSSSTNEKPLTPEEADRLMQTVVTAINQEQVDVLLPYLLTRDQAEANVEAAIADYKTYFRGEAIAGYERKNIESLGQINQQPIQRFNYRIYSASGISKNISIYQDQHIRLTDDFFLFSYWVRQYVDRFIHSVQTGNAKALTKILTADDLPYPVTDAERAIATYKAAFDVETLQAQMIGLDPQTNNFIYQLTGTQAGKPVEHFIQVTGADGLVSLQDEFVPDLP